MKTAQVSSVTGKVNPSDIPQFNWRQLAVFLLLPVAWWSILLHVITPLVLPAFSTPNGDPNVWLESSITTLAYLFEFFLALYIFRKEGYSLRLRALKERINWRWPRGWKAWGIILILFVVGFGITTILQQLTTPAIAKVLPPPDWWPAGQHPFKEVNSLADAMPGVVIKGNYLLLLLVVFSGTMNIVGEDLYYRGALIPKLHGLFGKWSWLAGGIIFALKHIYAWWLVLGDATALGIAGAFIFGPMGSLRSHFLPGNFMYWLMLFPAVFGGG